MNLKEAFAYQNFLNKVMDSTCRAMENNSVKQFREHMRSKSVDGAIDEMEEVAIDHPIPVDTLISFMNVLLKEREELCAAIEDTKQAQDFSMDVQYDLNRKRRDAVNMMERMLRVRRTERIISGNAYKINAEGNQVPYRYDVKVVNTENFDRERVRKALVSLRNTADEYSTKLDQMLVMAMVDFVPRFDVNDSFEDSIESFMTQ